VELQNRDWWPVADTLRNSFDGILIGVLVILSDVDWVAVFVWRSIFLDYPSQKEINRTDEII
jgi:hypothetical protein